MIRRLLAGLALLLLLAPLTAVANAPVAAPCTPALSSNAFINVDCPAIRPGARMTNGCTLAFIVTDGTDLYATTAGHCVGALGSSLGVTGVGTNLGTLVWKGTGLDAAAFRIDPTKTHLVDPTMARWAGPMPGPTGVNVRTPLPGEVLLHTGHGASLGAQEETRARVGVTLAPNLLGGILFAGSVDVGDSGSPVRIATGEAAGIAIATLMPGTVPNLVVATNMGLVLQQMETTLGATITVVNGHPPVAP